MTSFRDIVELLGTGALSRALVLPPRNVSAWKSRDSIPGEYWLKVAETAERAAEAETDPKRRARLEQVTLARMAEIAAAKAASSEAA